jgi:hypothetical protein
MARHRTVAAVLTSLAVALVVMLSPTSAGANFRDALVRTPSAVGPATPQTLALSDGSLGSTVDFNAWQETSTGVYTITFRNMSSTLAFPSLVHVSPFGRPGVACTTDLPVASGSDMKVTVRCTDLGGVATHSRFALSYLAELTTDPGATLGFFRTVGPAFWTADGSTPRLSHPSTGSFSVRFPNFGSNLDSRGNAHVTSTSGGRRCSVGSVTTNFVTGTIVNVKCVGAGGTAADADFYVSYGKYPMVAGTDNNSYLQVSSPTTVGPYIPSPAWQYLPWPVYASVTRKSAGRYVMSLPAPSPTNAYPIPHYSHDMTGVVTPINAPGNSCVFLDWDSRTATVQCVDSNGSPADTAFNLAMGSSTWSSPNSAAVDFAQISSKNFSRVADVGYGIACGVTVTAPEGQVQCILGTNAPVNTSSNVLTVAPSVTAPVAKAMAIDNIDAGATRILVLGADDRVWAASGDIRSVWASPGNFDNYVVYAEPFNPIGTRLFFRSIVSVRNAGSTSSTIVGITMAGVLFELEARPGGSWQWVGTSYPVPAGVPWASITHGVTDLYLLSNDGRMFRSQRSAASATQLPALPNGLLPVAMGGVFVKTNASFMSGCPLGYCCSGPDVNGLYPCDGDDQRFYQLVGNDVWAPVAIQTPFPPAGVPSMVIDNGNPFMADGFLVDGRMLLGDVTGIMAWQYNSRLYYFRTSNF